MELKAPKNQYNSFGKYNYRNCEDILEAVKPLCKKNNAVLTISDDILGGKEGETDRVYVKATAILTCIENMEEMTVHGFAREQLEQKGMQESQITGSASSYARKYALNGLFCIDDTKDADTQDNTVKPTKKDTSKEHKQEMTEYFSGQITTTIGKVTVKKDKSKTTGKPYTMYNILGENDKIYNTFSESIATLCKSAMESGCSVSITLKEDSKYPNTIETVEIIDE